MTISIITVNYNDAVGLEKTILSVANQTSLHIEYIVIDGGSKDDSVAVLRKHDKKIKHWISEKDSGVYSAMNKGIQVASGDYLLFLNSRDVLVDNKTVVEELLLNLNKKAVYYAPIYLAQNDFIKDKIDYPIEMDEKFLFTETICQQAVVYHKSVFKDAVFDEKLKYISDWKIHFFLFTKKIAFIHLDIPFAIYDLNGLTSKGVTKYKAHEERLKTQFYGWSFYFFKYYGMNIRMIRRMIKVLIKS